MPDVSIVQMDKTYAPDDGVARNKASAFALIRQLLSLQDVTEKHWKEQLSVALWKWTEAEGIAPHAKYNIRFVSRGVREAAGPARVNHEHVWTRKFLINELLGKPRSEEELKVLLDDFGVACIVTQEEHALLGRERGEGWARYRNAGIDVYDRAAQGWLDWDDRTDHVPAVTSERPAEVPAELQVDVADLIGAHCRSSEVAAQLTELLRTVRMTIAVASPSYKRSGEVEPYFRIHDALIEEPTAAVAYVHWSGKVDLRLKESDLPADLVGEDRVKRLSHSTYSVSCKITDAESRRLAEDLLFVALEKLRNEDL